MNKVEIINKVSEQIEGATKKDIGVVLDTIFDVIKTGIASGDTVKIAGFGNFGITERAARTGRNPKTGEAVEIAASKSPKFKAAKAFKEQVNA
jgi:DNA-binding protein HU-beta